MSFVSGSIATQSQRTCALAEARPELVELEMREGEVPKPVVVERGTVLAGPRQPGGDRALAVPEHSDGCGDREAFSHRTEDFCDPGGCGFEAIEGRVPTGGEGGLAGLTAEGLDALVVAVRAIADQGVHIRVGDAEIIAGGVRAGEAIGGDAFRGTTPALDLAPWTNG